MKNRKRIYPSLKAWRTGERLTQAEAAHFLALGQPTLSKYERHLQAPRPRAAMDISDKTGVPLENVLGIE
jgi:transcriptional regulator with XRE-family HTH domain